jgi:sugar phosphate isomerase/epimerase
VGLILDAFDEEGVRFAHEVHPSEIAYDDWTTQRTMEAIGHRPAFGLNWDPSHFVWQDLDPVGFLWDFNSTGHGDVPWEACFRMLNTIGYDGPISVEWEDAGMDRLVGAPEALEFIRRLAFDPPSASFDAAFTSR